MADILRTSLTTRALPACIAGRASTRAQLVVSLTKRKSRQERCASRSCVRLSALNKYEGRVYANALQNDTEVIDVTAETSRENYDPHAEDAMLKEMEAHVEELKAAVTLSLEELSRAAASLAPEIGLEEALLLKQAVTSELSDLTSRAVHVAEVAKEASRLNRRLVEAQAATGRHSQGDVSVGAISVDELRQAAEAKARQAAEELAELQGAAAVAERAVQALMEEGLAAYDGEMEQMMAALMEGEEGEGDKEGQQGRGERRRWQEEQLEEQATGGASSFAAAVPRLRRELGEQQDDPETVEEGEGAVDGPPVLPEWVALARERYAVKEQLAELFLSVGRLVREGRFRGALALLAANEAGAEEEVRQGGDPVEAAALLLTLAQLHVRLQGMPVEQDEANVAGSGPPPPLPSAAHAEALLRRAVALVEGLPPEPLLDDVLESAGDMLFGLRQFEAGVPLYRKALEVQQTLAGGRHQSQAATWASLASALSAGGRPEEAVAAMKEAVAVAGLTAVVPAGQADRGEPPETEATASEATLLVRLTQLQLEANMPMQARRSASRALAIMERRRGPVSVEAAVARFTLAQVAEWQAQEAMQRGGPGGEGEAGEVRREVQMFLDEAVDLLEDGIGAYKEAERRQRRRKGRAGEARSEEDDGDIDTLEQAMQQLAGLYDASGRLSDATALRAALLASREECHPPSSPALVPPLLQLAQSHLAQGDARVAEPLLQRALAIARAALPPGHLQLAVPLERMALCQLALDEFDAAERSAREHLAILEERSPEDKLAVSESLRNLALVQLAAGNASSAETHLRRGVTLARGVAGEEGQAATSVLTSSLSLCLQQQGRMKEAGELLQQIAEEEGHNIM